MFFSHDDSVLEKYNACFCLLPVGGGAFRKYFLSFFFLRENASLKSGNPKS